ncbi:hypothetical protein HPB47_010718 [Ixodes persulcatus]|uniref:Uncharacterized protein n=1 Tax=Ixodes persulcatus TaxID=34615 RepID=A0AC60NZ20_IXOPE|nr:hypothetical protein HPB47_010718 [Ixodes persulcatus]
MTLGGRGSLTAELITRLSSYYSWALKSYEDDVNAMHNAVMAVPFWRKNAVQTKCSPSKGGPYHACAALVPVHKHLADKKLLQWCKRGKIQNANESLHSVIWSLTPKDQNASLFTVESALAEATLRFNVGSQQASAAILRELNPDPSKKCMKRGVEKDLRRSAAREPAVHKAGVAPADLGKNKAPAIPAAKSSQEDFTSQEPEPSSELAENAEFAHRLQLKAARSEAVEKAVKAVCEIVSMPEVEAQEAASEELKMAYEYQGFDAKLVAGRWPRRV